MSDDDLTPAEKAYRAAQVEIARVKAAREDQLDLFGEEFHALTELPPEIATLTDLRGLRLSATYLSELAPIASLTKLVRLVLSSSSVGDISALRELHDLEELYLWGTNVSDLNLLRGLKKLGLLNLDYSNVADLTPLLPLRRLADAPTLNGLNFQYTPATRNDPKIAEIAEVEDDADRARQLFDYLRAKQKKEALPSVAEVLDAQDRTGWRFSISDTAFELFIQNEDLTAQ